MGGIEFAELLQYHKAESSEMFSYVTAYTTVILGLMGFLVVLKKMSLGSRVLIILGFLLFALPNYSSLVNSRRVHEAIHEEIEVRVKKENIKFYSLSLQEEMNKHHLPSDKFIKIVHGLLDLGVVFMIFFSNRIFRERNLIKS